MCRPTTLTTRMTVSKVEPSRHVKGRILIFFESGECWKGTEQEVLTFSLYPGRALSEEEQRELSAACGRSSAKAKAAEMIGSRALSRNELEKRLLRKGVDEEDAAAAVDWLEDIGALDDAAYARSVARHYAAMGYGPAKIRNELYRRGVPKALWDEAIEAECSDNSAAIERYIASKLRGREADEKTIRRISDGLRRRGFRWDEIKEALSRVREEIWEED